MNYYDILGVNEKASKEEIQKAYQVRLNKIKTEVTNERRIKLFTGALDEAYGVLIKEAKDRETLDSSLSNDYEDEFKTLVMDSAEVQRELEKQQRIYEERERTSSKKKSKSSSSSTSSKKKDKITSSDDKDKNEKARSKAKKVAVKSNEDTTNSVFNLLIVPLKILALPLIAVLTVVIIICKIISLISWIASKIVIVGGIGLGAIHLYQIHIGQAADKKLLLFAGIAVIVSFFLPYILKIVLKVLGAINDMLKGFVFN